MVNITGLDNTKEESDSSKKNFSFSPEYNKLIWTMKAVDYMNVENQENLSRVHVLCCNKCDFLTISLKALQQHMVLLHSLTSGDFNDLTIYSCQECKCVSTELKLIQEHIKIFHNILTDNSSVTKTMPKSASILTPLVHRNSRKPASHIKLIKTQLKIRKKILQRKSLKMKGTSDIDIETNNNNSYNYMTIKKENIQYNDRIEMSQDVNENDPLDMSMNSTTCPFKGIKCESMECNNYPYSVKQETMNKDIFEHITNNNPLLSNPQTCIELIKLTLNQILNKTTEQNHLSHLGFNNGSFLSSQFQLSSNIVPLLLPTASQCQGNNQAQNDTSFVSKNTEIEAILSNIQQQNRFTNSSPKTFEQTNHVIGYQQSPLFLNHKASGPTSNLPKTLFIENGQKKGTLSISPLSVYNSKKSTDFLTKTSNKRSLKKQTAPTKMRNGVTDEIGFLQNLKYESSKTDNADHENLFNRSFLDSNEIDSTNDQIILSKVLTEHDIIDSHINLSSKSSPNTLTNDKPHRQNFTSQQNRILSDWFFTHCDKPYPSTEDTKELSQLSGLTYSQVKKWFANKRARSSLNRKNHKNYCLLTPAESTMEEIANNDLLSISPSSDSNKSYTNQIDAPEAIDFTTSNQDDNDPQVN